MVFLLSGVVTVRDSLSSPRAGSVFLAAPPVPHARACSSVRRPPGRHLSYAPSARHPPSVSSVCPAVLRCVVGPSEIYCRAFLLSSPAVVFVHVRTDSTGLIPSSISFDTSHRAFLKILRANVNHPPPKPLVSGMFLWESYLKGDITCRSPSGFLPSFQQRGDICIGIVV